MDFLQTNITGFLSLKPELIISAGILLLLLSEILFEGRRAVKITFSIFILALSSVYVCLQFFDSPKTLFSGLLVVDAYSTFFKSIFLATAFFIILIISKSREFKGAGISELVIFVLTMTLGMMMLSSSTDFLMLYLSLETISLLSYVLVAYKTTHKASSEAALKYVIFGGVSSGIMLFGMSYLFGLTGTTNITEIGAVLSARGLPNISFPVLFATLLTLVGFGFKIAMVPFHMWCPDVYEGAPTPITAFLSIGPKAAGFAVLIRFLLGIFGVGDHSVPELFATIKMPELITFFSIVTMTLGNLAAINQTNLKRLLAYSSIAHAGYLLMGVATFSAVGIEAVLFYLPIYLFMNIGAFLVIIAVRDATESEDIKAYIGLGKRNPYLAISLAVFLFSLTGLPPMAGFLGKFYIFAAVIKKQMYVLATIGVINSVVSLFYYARIVKAMFLKELRQDADGEAKNLPVTSCNLYNILNGIFLAFNLLLIIYFQPLIKIVKISTLAIF